MDSTDKQTTTATASPRPWRVDGAFILDSAGGAIAMMCEPDYTCDAALIVEAVNNYKAESKKRHPDTEGERVESALESYRRPWSVSIDDENCRAVIRDADGMEVAYISDVIRSRAGETAQMFVGVAEERDRLRDIVRRLLPSLRRDIAQCNGPKQAPRLSALLDEARAAIGEGNTPCAK